ncbi:MAG: Crp/Fnr family transcriptional regulator [Deltaproteobacteria bacterium]|nr:Crp/Fnr family transcriptional regulator [Deltaproteobacteria bacterium]
MIPLTTIKNIPLFTGLSDQELDSLVKVAIKKTFPKSTVLCNEGDQSNSLYVICSGKVKVTKNDEDGKEVILAMLGPGEYFGEMSLLDSEPRSASVTTKEQTEIMLFSRDDFMRIFSSNPVASNLLKGLLTRLREANKKIESLALLDVYGRIAKLLNQLAEPQGDTLVIEERLTHQEIANMIGSSREMVTIILKELSNGEYISIDKKQITIKKKLPYAW